MCESEMTPRKQTEEIMNQANLARDERSKRSKGRNIKRKNRCYS